MIGLPAVLFMVIVEFEFVGGDKEPATEGMEGGGERVASEPRSNEVEVEARGFVLV